MVTMHLALVLIVVLLIFAAAWRWLPSGWLTAATGAVPAVVIVVQEVAAEHMTALKAVMPTEAQPWLLFLFIALTIAARFRGKVSS